MDFSGKRRVRPLLVGGSDDIRVGLQEQRRRTALSGQTCDEVGAMVGFGENGGL